MPAQRESVTRMELFLRDIGERNLPARFATAHARHT